MGAQIASANLVSPLRLDVGISTDGPDHDPFAKALCVGRWGAFDGHHHAEGPAAQKLATICAACPVIDACRERTRETDMLYGATGFAAGFTAGQRQDSLQESTADYRMQQIRPWHAQGMSDEEIGAEIGLSRQRVSHYRARMGLKPNGDGRGGARGRSQIERVR